VVDRVLRLPLVRSAAQRAANFVDIQWTLIDDTLHQFAPRARGRLLDVGCGDKPYEAIFRPHVTDYVGIEHESSFAETSACSSDRKPDLYYDGTRLPFADESFDTVMSIQVLEHTPRPQHLLNDMARVVVRGGVVLLCAPFSFRLHGEPHDYFRYSPHGLREMCAQAGVRILEMHPLGNLWSVLGHKLNSFLAFRVARLGGVGQAVGKVGHEPEERVRPRLWTVPAVACGLVAVSTASRVLDRVIPDRTESLGYLLVGERT
jgi:SAM-dependent methyltransferase